MSTFGPTFSDPLDGERITDQMGQIRDLMVDGVWRTLSEIEKSTRYPQASISAQLRHLRKPQFGAFLVQKRRRSTGTWEYHVVMP